MFDISTFCIIDISDFTCTKWNSIFPTPTPIPLTVFLSSGSENFILPIAQARSWGFTFEFPLSLTLRMHTESDHFLPRHSTTQIWAPTFLVWIYWNSLLSDLSASSYVPLTQSAQKPPVALHFRVVATFLKMVAKALHALPSYDLPDPSSNYLAWFTGPLAVPRKCLCLENSFLIRIWLTPFPPSSLSSNAMLLRRPH